MDNPGYGTEKADPVTVTVNSTVEVQTNGGLQTDDANEKTKGRSNKLGLIYTVTDVPPWYLCLFLGFQHYLTMFGANISIPLILAPALCMTNGVHVSEFISTCFFVSGLVTIIQVSVGIRLPIVQGGTFAFLSPAFAILSLPKWQCPEASSGNMTDTDNMTMGTDNITAEREDDDGEIWKIRMRELQGAIILASLLQVVIGITGLIGLLLRFITPLVIAPTIALVGLALFKAASNFSSTNWAVAVMTMVLIIIFSQYIRDVGFPCCAHSKEKGCRCKGYPLFKLFPVILAILVSWGVCGILTVTDAIPNDNTHWAYKARTDPKSDVLFEAKWFRFPYPVQWGTPTFSAASVFGMMSGVLAGIVESIGDYYACARLSGAPPPPLHAVNRGVLMEGIGCILAGLWGTGTGTTSYSENVGAIGITKVSSRRVVIFGAVQMILLGMLGKFGALFVTIPDPIIGGVFMVMFGMITAVGISNLQFVDMNSTRNLFIFGFSLMFGLSLPEWFGNNNDVIQTGNTSADQIITVLLSTSMFVGGMVAFILDNTVPGTDEERGLLVWKQQLGMVSEHCDGQEENEMEIYNLPFIMPIIRKWNWTKYMPICPSFQSCGFNISKQEQLDSDFHHDQGAVAVSNSDPYIISNHPISLHHRSGKYVLHEDTRF